jgi:hypothetical protein
VSLFIVSLDDGMTRLWRIRRYFAYQWERAYPYGFGLLMGLCMIGFGPGIFSYTEAHNIHVENTYTAVAGVFAIIAGFLASFYGSVQALADSRLKRIAKTSSFTRLVAYIKEATISGFLLSAISIPFIVISPTKITGPVDRVALAVWCGLAVYAFLAFVRVGRSLFFVFEHQPPPDEGAV